MQIIIRAQKPDEQVTDFSVSWNVEEVLILPTLDHDAIQKIHDQIKAGIEAGYTNTEWFISIPNPETGDFIPVTGWWRILEGEERDWTNYFKDDRIFDANDMGNFAYRMVRDALEAAMSWENDIQGLPPAEYIRRELENENGDDSYTSWRPVNKTPDSPPNS